MSSPKTVFGLVGLGALLVMLTPVLTSAQALTPSITNVAAAPTADGTGAGITWTTDIPSNSQVEYGTTTSYGTFSAILDGNGVTSHSVPLSALQPNTLYHYAVLSMASSSSATSSSSFAAASADHTFVTLSASGATTTSTSTSVSTSTGTSTTTSTSSPSTSSPPVIGGIMSVPTATTSTITWTTDQPATSQVAFGTSTNYSASTTADTSLVTSHSVSLSGLMPSLLYHFQVIAGNGSTTATSSDQTFMTLASTSGTTTATSTASTTPITISNIAANPGTTTATVTWNTDQPSSSQVEFGTTTGNYFASTTPDNSSVTSHSVGLFGLTPNLLYHFRVWSSTASTTASSSDQSFMTLASGTGTSTGTSTSTSTATSTTSTSTPTTSGGLTMDDLFNLIQQLQARVAALESQVQSLLAGGGSGNNGGTSTTTPTTPGNAYVDQNGQTFKLGGSVDFGGHNFGSEEYVRVMLNGQQITTGFTNTGGGFSTGSLSLPSSPGTYTYTFIGQVSGKTAQATITVQ